jgi:hypothetical protein
MNSIADESPPTDVPVDEEILDVVVHFMHSFDVGYEIDLDRVRPVFALESGVLPRRRRTPESIRYRPAPLRTTLDVTGLALPGGFVPSSPPRAELTLFDFAALSVTIQFPLKISPAELLRLAGELSEPTSLTASARLAVAPWIDRIKPMVTEFELGNFSEEYVIFQLQTVDLAWLERREDWVAGLVRLEPEPLSENEIQEATRLSLSYTPKDRVTLDWAAAVVADRDCIDTIQVIEFANVQLLEFRHIDDRLDDRIEAAYRLIRPEKQQGRPLGFWRSHSAAVRSVRELEIEATSLFERADNNLKLIGDQYLSRVYDLAQTRFHLPDWEQSIRRKLDTVGDVYDLLVQQAGGLRMELLELVVVLLITLEIVLAFFRH